MGQSTIRPAELISSHPAPGSGWVSDPTMKSAPEFAELLDGVLTRGNTHPHRTHSAGGFDVQRGVTDNQNAARVERVTDDRAAPCDRTPSESRPVVGIRSVSSEAEEPVESGQVVWIILQRSCFRLGRRVASADRTERWANGSGTVENASTAQTCLACSPSTDSG